MKDECLKIFWDLYSDLLEPSDELLYIPYSEAYKLELKDNQDTNFIDWYCRDFITSKADVELPFYWKIGYFKLISSVKEVVDFVIHHIQTNIKSLLVDFAALKQARLDSFYSGKSKLLEGLQELHLNSVDPDQTNLFDFIWVHILEESSLHKLVIYNNDRY